MGEAEGGALALSVPLTQPIAGLDWFDLDDTDSLELNEFAARYRLHELDIEDVRHGCQRPKIDEHPDYIFVVFKELKSNQKIEFDDFYAFIGRNFLLTIHPGPSDTIAKVVRRAQEEHVKRLDRIFYYCFDDIVDDFLPVLDGLAEDTSAIEDEVLEHPTPDMLRRIFQVKRKLIDFRRNAAAMREAANSIQRIEHGVIGDDLDEYLRDIYDHLIRTVELIESYRDLLTGSLDIYLSAVANRTNEVMKVLTIWGTVALPLVIITGFFGMNLPLPFQHTPHGTALAVGIMLFSTAATLLYFKRKGWF
jgi:magnesium transporter